MELSLLIADSRRMYRKGFRSIFSRDPLIASIEEAATAEELNDKLATTHIGAVIVNQLLIPDISTLPENSSIVECGMIKSRLWLKHIKFCAMTYAAQDNRVV